MGRKTTYAVLFVLYLTAVFTLCLIRPENMPEIEKNLLFGIPTDKAAHFIMFLPYPLLAAMTFTSKGNGIRRNMAIIAIIAVMGIGIAYGTEALQGMTDYRSRETADLAADMAGLAVGILLAAAYTIHQNRKA